MRDIMVIKPELTDELIEKICNIMESGWSYPFACDILLIPPEVYKEWFYAGKHEEKQKLVDFYKRIKSVKRDPKSRMTPHQQRVILKCSHNHNREERMYDWCDFLCKTPFELDELEAGKMISDLKLVI